MLDMRGLISEVPTPSTTAAVASASRVSGVNDGRGASEGRSGNGGRGGSGSRFLDDAASMSQSGHSNDYDSRMDEMSDAGRAFIDDEGSIRSSFHGHPDNEDRRERVSLHLYRGDPPRKNNTRKNVAPVESVASRGTSVAIDRTSKKTGGSVGLVESSASQIEEVSTGGVLSSPLKQVRV
jgi:hypothetical protein